MIETGMRNAERRRRGVRLPRPRGRPLEPRRAAALRTRAEPRRGAGRRRRPARRRHRRAHRPQPQGQVHRPRRGDRAGRLVGQQQRHDARAVRDAQAGFPRPCAGQDAVRAGPLRRRGAWRARARARLHRACLALAVHPQPADPAGGRGARRLRAGADDRRPAELLGRPRPPRRPLLHHHRLRFLARDRADRRHVLCGRDEEVRVHLSELSPARQTRDADALLGQHQRRRRDGDLLRPLRHRQDHALGRPRPHADRRRRARLEPQRRVQLRGRLLRQGDQAVARGRARDLRHHRAFRHGDGERDARPRKPRARFRRRQPHREHPHRLSARLHRQRLGHGRARRIPRTS